LINTEIKLLLIFAYRKQNKKSLIFLPDAIIHPRAVVIHLSNTSFANTEGKEERLLLRNNTSHFNLEIRVTSSHKMMCWNLLSWKTANSDFTNISFAHL